MGKGEMISTPYFLVDEGLLRKNLKILKDLPSDPGIPGGKYGQRPL